MSTSVCRCYVGVSRVTFFGTLAQAHDASARRARGWGRRQRLSLDAPLTLHPAPHTGEGRWWLIEEAP